MNYSTNDLTIIYSSYFTVITFSLDYLELQSNNTKHCWRLRQSSDGFYQIEHKHHISHKYHIHSAAVSLFDCFLEITSHDDFQIRGRKPERIPTETFFDEIIKIYDHL